LKPRIRKWLNPFGHNLGAIPSNLINTTADFLVDNRDDSLYHPWHPGA
jgi:hypothetical protein